MQFRNINFDFDYYSNDTLMWERQIRQPLVQPALLAFASISLSTSRGSFLPGIFPLLASMCGAMLPAKNDKKGFIKIEIFKYI